MLAPGFATRRRLFVIFTLLVHTAALAQAPPPKPAAKPAEEPTAKTAKKPPESQPPERSRNVESFEVVWKTIRDKHYDPKLGGLDWQSVHDAIRPKVEAATTMKDARAAISEAIDRLHQTHFGIIPTEIYESLENPNEGPGEIGLDVRLVDGRAVVSAVPGGPAGRGLRRSQDRLDRRQD